MIEPKSERRDLLRSANENCEKLSKQTERKPQETLDCRLTQQREPFSFKLSVTPGLDSKWMIGLTSLEV